MKFLAALLLVFGIAHTAFAQSQTYPINSGTRTPVVAGNLWMYWNGTNAVPCTLSACVGGGGGGGGAITAAAGSYSAGALVDGASVTQGTKADTAYTGSGSASEIAIQKGIYNILGAALPAGTNAIGSVTVSNFPATQPVSGAAGAGAGWNGYALTPGSTTGLFAPIVQGIIRTPTNGGLTAGNNQAVPITVGGTVASSLWSSNGTQIGSTSSVNAASTSGAPISTALAFFTSPSETASNLAIISQGDQYGGAFVDTEGLKPSYISSFSVTPASIGIFAQICGPSSGATRLRAVSIQGDATTAGLVTLVLSKNSTAATGGTSAAITPTPMDATNDSADTASVLSYSAQPTAGALVGNVATQLYYIPAAASVGSPVSIQFGNSLGMQSLVLRSAAQCVALATSGTLPTGTALVVNIYDTRE